MRPGTIKIMLTVFVLLHLGGNVWHGDAHTTLGVWLTTAQNLFVWIVIILGPLLGLALVWMKRLKVGTWIIAGSMVGSLMFSVYYHFIFISHDNVEHLPPGSAQAHTHFFDSAQFIALAALAGLIFAFYAVGTLNPEPGAS